MSATARSERDHGRVRLTIDADRCVEMLPRVLGIFSQQSLIPAAMSLHGLGAALSLTIIFDDPEERLADLLVSRIRRIVSIRSITLMRIDAAISPSSETLSATRHDL